MMRECSNQNGEARAIQTDVDHPQFGWVFYRHPDGGWVTLRKATDEEMYRANLPQPLTSESSPIGQDEGLAAAYTRELDKVSQRNYELRMELATIRSQIVGMEKDAARWRMLPAFIQEHQIDYVDLKRSIDDAIAPTSTGEENV